MNANKKAGKHSFLCSIVPALVMGHCEKDKLEKWQLFLFLLFFFCSFYLVHSFICLTSFVLLRNKTFIEPCGAFFFLPAQISYCISSLFSVNVYLSKTSVIFMQINTQYTAFNPHALRFLSRLIYGVLVSVSCSGAHQQGTRLVISIISVSTFSLQNICCRRQPTFAQAVTVLG